LQSDEIEMSQIATDYYDFLSSLRWQCDFTYNLIANFETPLRHLEFAIKILIAEGTFVGQITGGFKSGKATFTVRFKYEDKEYSFDLKELGTCDGDIMYLTIYHTPRIGGQISIRRSDVQKHRPELFEAYCAMIQKVDDILAYKA